MALTINVNVTRRVGGRRLRRLIEEGLTMVLNLTTAVDRLTAAVDRVAAGGGTGGGVPQADIDAEASRIDEQSARLEALPTPPGTDPASLAASPHRK